MNHQLSERPVTAIACTIGSTALWGYGKRLVACLLILVMQGPAMVFQELAWIRMLPIYTQERGLARGVVETFNGEHPCELCLKAKKIREDDKRRQTPEKPGDSKRQLLAWAEMLAGKSFTLPPVRGECQLQHGEGHFPSLVDHPQDGPRPPPPRGV